MVPRLPYGGAYKKWEGLKINKTKRKKSKNVNLNFDWKVFWKDSGGGLWKFWSQNKVLWTFVRLGYHSTVDLLGCAASRQSIEERDMQREMESTWCLPGEILRRDGQWRRWDGKWDGDWLGLATTELQHAGGVWSPSVTCRTAVTFNLSFSCQIKPLLSLSLSPAYSMPSDFVWSRKKSQNNSETWRQTLAKNIQIKMFDICKVTQTRRDKTDWTCRGSNGQASSCHSERERSPIQLFKSFSKTFIGPAECLQWLRSELSCRRKCAAVWGFYW